MYRAEHFLGIHSQQLLGNPNNPSVCIRDSTSLSSAILNLNKTCLSISNQQNRGTGKCDELCGSLTAQTKTAISLSILQFQLMTVSSKVPC